MDLTYEALVDGHWYPAASDRNRDWWTINTPAGILTLHRTEVSIRFTHSK